MKIDNLGLPKDNGASDLQDSSRLAGVMALFCHPIKVPIQLYVISKGKYVRHPREYIYTFSRDQTICLFAGLTVSGFSPLIDPDYKTEGDLVDPGTRGHIRRCAGLQATWFQNTWLKAALLFHAIFTPLDEPNQMLCMAMIAGDEYVKLWANHNPKWAQSIIEYWGGWRNELELAHLMIHKVQSILA